MTTKQQIENIEQKIKKHEYDFFVLGEETLSRPEMEILKVELYHLKKKLEEEEKAEQSISDAGDSLFEFYDGI